MEKRKQPTIDQAGDLLVKIITDMDEVHTRVNERCRKEDELDQPTVHEVLDQYRKVYTDALAAGCELIGASEDDWDCIFDADRPKEEWNLLDNTDLLGPTEGAD